MEKIEFEERKNPETPRLEEEAKARLILDAVGDYAIMLLDAGGAVTMWSQGAERILGYPEREILGRSAGIFFLPEERESGAPEEEMRNAASAGRAEDERWHVRKDGRRFFASGVLTGIKDGGGRLMGYCKVLRDITDRMTAQEALRQSQEYFAALVDSIEGIVWEADGLTGRHTFVNKKAESILGHSQEVWLREYWDRLIYEEDRNMVRTYWEKAFREKKGYTLDFRLLDAEGRKRWFRDYVSAVEQPSGAVKLRAVLVEVTSQKAAERRQEMQLQVTTILARSSELQKAVEEILPILGRALEWDVVIYWHMRHLGKPLATLQYWNTDGLWAGNGHFRHILGDPSHPGDVVGAALAAKNPVWVPDLSRLPGENRPLRLAHASEAGLMAGLACPVLVGEEVHGVLEFFSSISRPEDPAIMGSAFAVASQIGQFENRLQAETALWESQEQLRQSQKMEAIGRLAGGIAHDFNNLLTAINGYGDLLLDKMEPDSPYRGDLEEIRKAGKRAASLTHQLLAYSRKQVLTPKVLNLNIIMSEMGSLLRRLLGEDILLEMRPSQDLKPIKMDPGQLEQVIMNLALNSRDAMPDGGRLILETSNEAVPDRSSDTYVDPPPGDYVRLSVTDTGRGIPDSVKERLFEPFFTTKEIGKGTGLGLSMVYGIVKQSGGSISVNSEPGKGATFSLYLPVAKDSVKLPSEPEAREARRDASGETILLVEDEEGVRNLAREILAARGYNVIAAKSGEDALSAEAGHAGPIDLLLTDFIMQGMNGREVYEALARRRPGVKVLYMSGYTEDEIIRHGVETSGSAFLQKPFSPNALVDKVDGFFKDSHHPYF